MFSLEKTPFGPFEQYVFQSPDGLNSMKLVPGAGANLIALTLKGKSILDGYNQPEALQKGIGGKSAVLFPFPNRLDGGRYQFFGQHYAFPINNPDTDNAIHGFVRHEAFVVDNIVLARNYASLTCSYHYSGKHDYYPFPFQLDIEFALYARGALRLSATVRNYNHFDMPMGFGWHPYFKLSGSANDHALLLPDCERIDVDDRLLPTGVRTPFKAFGTGQSVGQTHLDACFAYKGSKEYYDIELYGAQKDRLRMRLDAKAFPFFQVFTPPDRESIALEPMSCNINAFQNGDGLVELGVNGTWSGHLELIQLQ
jgi:aldose 1-epimerase